MFCDYGCGNEYTHILKNGKKCCSISYQKCPALRKRNSNGLKKAHKEGRIDCSHFNGKRGWRKGKNALTDNRIGKSFDDIFSINSDSPSKYLKKIIINNNLKSHTCEKCGIKDSWQNEPITLELDHINGIRSDNRLINLRFLCPNCHSQTTTFKGRNIDKNKIKVDDKELLLALKNNNSIRKALIEVGMDPKGANYNRVYYIMGKYDIIIGNKD